MRHAHQGSLFSRKRQFQRLAKKQIMSLLDILHILLKIVLLTIQAFLATIFRPAKKSVRGQVVLITGAGHGLGREFAKEFARLGARVVMWDLNEENNVAAAAEIREDGGEAYAYTCDVTKLAAIHAVAQKVREEVGEVSVLVNNAGILYGGALLDMEERHIRRTFEVNTLAHFWMVREFLPVMLAKNEGHIVTIASMAAKSGTAYLVDYSSSKHAAYGFTEALNDELIKLKKPGIKTTVVCPFFIDTGLCKFPKSKFDRVLTPKEVVIAALDGILRDEEYIYVPNYQSYVLTISGLLPLRVKKFLKEAGDYGISPQYQPGKQD